MVNIQNYVRVKSLEEAYELNQKKQNRIIGGMLWTKLSRNSIQTAIDLCDLGLDRIEENEEQFSIGAMVSLRDIENHSGINTYSCGAVKKALQNIVGVQFRNLATIGGSLWGRFGFSDVLTVFLSMDSYVELYKGGIIPLEQFAKMKYDNDILVRLIVKKSPGKFVYDALRIQKTDFPIITCAVSKIGEEYRAVIGARPSKAIIIRDEKGILNSGINDENSEKFSDYVAKSSRTSGNMRASAEYRKHIIRILTKRNIIELGSIV